MNNNEIIVENTERDPINRCSCSKCKGCAGTARACFNSRKLALRTAKNAPVKTVGLILLLACFFPQGRATACVSLPEVTLVHPGRDHQFFVHLTLKDESPIDRDYYQSRDNPFRAD